MITNVRTSTWVPEDLEATLPDAWGADETTEIDLAPAGARALPIDPRYLEDVPSEIALGLNAAWSSIQ